MNYDNGFKLLIAVILNMTPQLVGLVPNAQEPVITFCIGEVEFLTYFHLRPLAIKNELISMKDKTCHIKNLTGKYIMELSKLKHIQRYMNLFDINFRQFELQPQIYQLKYPLHQSIDIYFEYLEAADIEMNPSQ